MRGGVVAASVGEGKLGTGAGSVMVTVTAFGDMIAFLREDTGRVESNEQESWDVDEVDSE